VAARSGATASGTTASTQGIVAARFGGPEVLEVRALEARAPGPGEVRVRHTAIGVNYIDIYVRKGQYRLIEPPAPLGMEAAGEVLDVGDGVAHLLPGDRVAYACAPPGAYVGIRTLQASQLVVLPDDIEDEAAAGLMLKGMTAEYLLHRTHRVQPGETVLVHAAAGGVGLLLCQWAKALGAKVIGTVSTDAKARAARAAGCDQVIVGRDYRFASPVHDVTGGRGADVIYDGLGQAAAQENHDALARCGHWICYGQASGPLDRLSIEGLGEKSATFTSPVLFHYTAERAALNEIAGHAFQAVRDGVLRLDIRHRYPLAAAAQAHRDLESRATIGPLILLP
jgi:NADPH:quinone reductase-like Zn-dependent oxidoreductase